MKKIFFPLLFAALTLAQGTAGAWGFFGHRTITQVAVYQLPASMQAFYYRHMAELVRLSTAPDERRSQDTTEGPKHFINMDYYSEENPFAKVPRRYEKAVEKFTADTLKKYGTVPWTIIETKNSLTEAFRQRDTVNIIKYSAELSHYMSDAFVPLHTTLNYDGQFTNQKGLHKLWETQLPERFINEYKLNGEPAKYLDNPLVAVWNEVQQSYGFVGETFDQATKIEKVMKPAVRYTFAHHYGQTTRRFSDAFADAYEKAVGGMVSFRLKGAPTMVSSLWLTAWQDAGKPDLNSLMIPNKQTKSEKEKLSVEMAAWKNNTLPHSQLLLAQQKEKKEEIVDEIKSATEDIADPTKEGQDGAPAGTAGEPAPAANKLKVKTKGKEGTQKIKQKGDAPQ
ncbi:hypothetical protein IC235_19465 [Hymenobacter sp. BT664]|uniref:S1/P1 Nuclease n=1 Tax=Hymenobacter montanus TaxID=2771359 RepID=A0A927BHF9_9BACT|nr:zinc dependent phospholipase C family protein [Hymenobacter montanus]MBD2770072.1 hypothetical protein [Hymenobacter montanus]